MRRPFAGCAGQCLTTTLAVALGFGLCVSPAAAEVIRGRARDPHDRAVALADVILMQGSRVVLTAKTSADGRFGPLAAPPGEYDLVVSAPGLRSAPRRVTITSASGDLDLDLRLALAAVQESVVVTPARVDTALSTSPSGVTVLHRADLAAAQIDTVADAVRRAPGFGVVQSGTRGSLTSFFPRGGESDYTLVLADGIPLNAFGGGFDAAHLAVADVERVEIVRGPQSALYGGGAIGGVVQVVTRSAGPIRVEGVIEAGGYGTTLTRAGAAGSRGAWTWGGAFDWATSDGQVENDDYESLAGSGSLGWSDGRDRRARVDVRLGRNERGNPGPYGSDPLGLYDGIDTISRGINHTRAIGALAAVGSSQRLRHVMQFTWTDAPSDYTSPFGESEDRSRRVSGRYQIDLDRGDVGLSAGWEGLSERADNTFITDETFGEIPVERSLNGFFAEARWRPDARGLVHAGLRVERIARGPLEGDPNPFGPRPAFDEEVVWSANPKVAVSWRLRDSDRSLTRIHGGAGTGIKPPTAFEIAFTDNPSLKPERSISADAGIEHAAAGGAFVLDATWFYNRYDQLIVAVGSSLTGASRYRTDNIANARAQGLELGASWRGPRGLSARVAWTFLDTEVLAVDNLDGQAPPPYAVGDPLIRRPGSQGLLDVAWSNSRARLAMTINGRGDVTDLEPNFAQSLYTNPGYVTTMIGASITIAPGLEVYGRITNLFDRTYEEVYGYPALGRAGMIGLRIARSR